VWRDRPAHLGAATMSTVAATGGVTVTCRRGGLPERTACTGTARPLLLLLQQHTDIHRDTDTDTHTYAETYTGTHTHVVQR